MYKALIIDDERPVHVVITKLGKWREYDIEPPYSAYHGRDGIKALRELRPDIVFVDMQMPVMGGIEFLNQASMEFPKTKYIVVSGYDDFSYAQIAIKNGAIDYLLKPVVAADLDKALSKAVSLLNREHNISPEKAANEVNLPPKEVINEIKDYIDKNYTTDIKISMFSDKYFFSKEYLSKSFKKEFGYGIYEYALKLRMERAKELLNDPTMQIKDIAERLGYSNNNYFSKAFKNYYNISPTEFRS
jgi:two-component system, response regulator YesN